LIILKIIGHAHIWIFQVIFFKNFEFSCKKVLFYIFGFFYVKIPFFCISLGYNSILYIIYLSFLIFKLDNSSFNWNYFVHTYILTYTYIHARTYAHVSTINCEIKSIWSWCCLLVLFDLTLLRFPRSRLF